MGALLLSTPFQVDLFPAHMSVSTNAKPRLGACCMVITAELYQRRGACVSINVRPSQVCEDELGPVITLDHAPKRLPRVMLPETDQQLVAELLRKVQATAPDAVMKWNEEEGSWYIKAKKPARQPAKPALRLTHLA